MHVRTIPLENVFEYMTEVSSYTPFLLTTPLAGQVPVVDIRL